MRLQLDEDSKLICPVCDWNYVHITQVEAYSAGGKSIGIQAGGEDDAALLVIGDAAGPESGEVGRRHVFVLKGHCEAEHTFDIEFLQHKGETFVKVIETGVPKA